jgi:hypothetical protein
MNSILSKVLVVNILNDTFISFRLNKRKQMHHIQSSLSMSILINLAKY